MEKYLGNKTGILPLIGQFVADRVPCARSISDLFGGTTNVSRYFRQAGFNVITGDLNRFTYVLARAYLTHSHCPTFSNLDGNFEETDLQRLRFSAEEKSRKSGAKEGGGDIRHLCTALATLQSAGRSNKRRGVFFEHFTQEGRYSAFTSVRGSSGRRNYFTGENALFLDGALEALRQWRCEERLTSCELFLLLASVIEEVVITANVSGTFHDFSRDRLWPNATQRFTLRIPPVIFAKQQSEILNAEAIDAAGAVDYHDICYIDPPYNFRQYGAYYHLINFVAAYPFLASPCDYAAKLSFVRGQNMADDHTSRFCFRDDFISSMRSLIQRVPAKHVILSYYGGRNHWNHWSATDKPTDRGLQELGALFRDLSLFDECEIIPALSVRQNYQSRAGEKKNLVNEYLLMGSRVRVPKRGHGPVSALPANLAIGVAEHFGHFFSGGEKLVPCANASTDVCIAVG